MLLKLVLVITLSIVVTTLGLGGDTSMYNNELQVVTIG